MVPGSDIPDDSPDRAQPEAQDSPTVIAPPDRESLGQTMAAARPPLDGTPPPPSNPYQHFPPPPGYWGPPTPRPGPAPPQKRSRAPWILSGVVLLLVVALVVVGIVWWQRASDETDAPDLLAGHLTGAYPTAPTAAWSVTPAQFGGTEFISPLPWLKQYRQVGVIHDDTMAITLVGDDQTSYSDVNTLVGVNTATGKYWKFDTPVAQCADTVANGALACADRDHAYIIDAMTGRTRESMPMGPGYGIAFNGIAVFTRTYTEDASRRVIIAKLGSNGPIWERNFELPDPLPTGDSSNFTATDDFVASGDGNITVVSADDGRLILGAAGTTTIEKRPDGSMLVVTGTTHGGNPTNGPVVLIRADGTTMQLGVAAAIFPGPDQANTWCRAQGFTKDNCFAKLVSTTAGPDGSTRYWS